MRRARVRQHFIDNLEESRLVLDTKIDGFLASTHLWAGEAVYHQTPLQLIYVSSRQAIDPGVSVPAYAMSNWAVLQLPKVLAINLGRQAQFVTAASILLPFVRTSMTDEYASNPKVFGRWQPRMLETHEAAQAFLQLLTRPKRGTRPRHVRAARGRECGTGPCHLERGDLDLREEPLSWSEAAPLQY